MGKRATYGLSDVMSYIDEIMELQLAPSALREHEAACRGEAIWQAVYALAGAWCLFSILLPLVNERGRASDVEDTLALRVAALGMLDLGTSGQAACTRGQAAPASDPFDRSGASHARAHQGAEL